MLVSLIDHKNESHKYNNFNKIAIDLNIMYPALMDFFLITIDIDILPLAYQQQYLNWDMIPQPFVFSVYLYCAQDILVYHD